jgi:hypothetical protein
MTRTPSPSTEPDYSEALARALAYTVEVGLSDGTDRPARTAAEVLEPPTPQDRGQLVRSHAIAGIHDSHAAHPRRAGR